MAALISLALLLLLTPLFKANSQGNLTLDLKIGEECGSIHNIGQNLTIYLSVKGGPAAVTLWAEYPDKTKRILKELNTTEGTYEIPFSLSNAPPGLWMLHAVAVTDEGIQKSVVCSVLVIGEEGEASTESSENNLEFTEKNMTLRVLNLPMNATVGDEGEFLVEVHNRGDRNRSLRISCGGEGIFCIPDQRNLTIDPNSNATLNFRVVFDEEGDRALVIAVYENDSLLLSRKFFVRIVGSGTITGSGFKGSQAVKEPESSSDNIPTPIKPQHQTTESVTGSSGTTLRESSVKGLGMETLEIALVILGILLTASIVILMRRRKT